MNVSKMRRCFRTGPGVGIRMKQNPSHAFSLLFRLILLPFLAGCSTARRVERLDAKVQGFLRDTRGRELPGVPGETLDLAAYEEFPAGNYPPVVHLNLARALQVAARHSREYQRAKETLYAAAISLYVENHRWEWNVTNNLNGLLSRNLDLPETSLSADAQLGWTRRFFSGARLTTSLALDTIRYVAGDRGVDVGSLAQLTLTQPLLAGYGPLVAREPLTQRERGLVYALRTYVRQRKSLLIDIAEKYYGVLSSLDNLRIARQNYENLKASRERSEAKAESGRIPLFQVDQARQRELAANASLVTREEAYQDSKDALKNVLGMPLEMDLEVDGADLDRLTSAQLPEPPLDFEAARRHALDSRYDFATVKARLEDAERDLKIKQDALRAKLDLQLSATAGSPNDDHLRGIVWDKGTYSAGMDAELPFDRVNETAAYRQALIERDRRTREVYIQKDRIIRSLRSVWRRLNSSAQNYEIQKLSFELAEKRIESTELLFEAGRIDIRELLDARDALVVARNALTVALVDHRINWLKLLYQLEDLPVDPVTLWSPGLEGKAVTVEGQTP